MIYVLLILGALTRLILIPLPGFKADMAYWKGWGLAAADRGIIWLTQNTNFNYPPGFAYVLMAVNKFYALFKSPYIIKDYWNEANFLYLLIFKSIPFISDVIIVYLLYKIGKALNSKLGLILGLIFFLSPAVIYDGVLWGQVDSFGLMLFLASIYLLLKDRCMAASAVFTISYLMKFQNIIFIPLFYLYLFKKYDFKMLIKSLQWSTGIFLLFCLPFILTRNIATLIRLLTVNSDWFPYYSLNAFNLWWIAAAGRGIEMIDKNLVVGVVNAKTVGLYLFVISYFIATLYLFFSDKEHLFKNFIISCAFAIYSFFMLPTQSHDRYAFHLLGLIPIILFFIPREKLKAGLIFYLTFSFLFFLNLYLAMNFYYPDMAPWFLSNSQTIPLTILLSVVGIGVYIYFFVLFMGRQAVKHWAYYGSFTILIVMVIFIKNIKYIKSEPISLSSIAPVEKKQDFLLPVWDMTVNSGIAPNYWQRLSDNYFFYERGIGAHAQSSIDYRINGKFRKFETEFGMDTEADVEGKAIFAVEADGREIFRSKEKGRFDLPGHVELDITGTKLLTLKIYKVGDSINGAHADWLGPVLIR